jgi:cell division protein FtsN
MKRRFLVAIFAAALVDVALSYYVNTHNIRVVTEPCRRNAAGEEVCPPPFKP